MAFKPIVTRNVWVENINFETDTEPVQCWKKYKQNNPCYLQKSHLSILIETDLLIATLKKHYLHSKVWRSTDKGII